MIKLKIQAGGQSDVGLKREHNEDSILLSKELGLFAVADGMGGHAAGEVASRLTVTNMLDFVRRLEQEKGALNDQTAQEGLSPGEKILYLAISNANKRLCVMSEENSSYFGMGTTVAAIYVVGDQIHIAHVGDSRVYRLRDNTLELLTQDHSWVNEQLQKNVLSEDEARNHRWRNVITRALGNRADVEIDIKTVEAKEGDLYLLCSDGLTTMVDDAGIARTLVANGPNLEKSCAELVRAANDAGGHDNVSVVLIRVENQSVTEDDAETKPANLTDISSEITQH
ncbi:Stp1/IreP family PP2C-type Ser/Thr phosphatase [Candidatus Sumerlaeota bacterium]|nr:Stp1/IreP family PP2C-type Ser/Thr phosphatase [Candidatus Sumerlaeota bacterium]